MIKIQHLPIRRVTNGPKHHFFGYFDKFPWDKKGRRLLTMEVDFVARQPVPGEKASICVIEEDGTLRKVAETDAWCWQQACMLQWLNDADSKIIYNDREGDHFVARILDVDTGETETLDRPIYCLSPDGKWAITLNFSRLDRERPGYGYPGAFDPYIGKKHPDDDGVWLIDLKKNKATLSVSVDRVTREFYRTGSKGMEHGPGWFNHMLFSPNSERIAFFHRWRVPSKNGAPWHVTHMFTANRDGSELFPLNLQDMSSHYTWVGQGNQIINFSNQWKTGWQYHLFTDQTDKVEVIAKDVFPGDGHCSYSSDCKWMLTDSYPLKDQCRHLYLYDLANQQAYEIGSFYSDPNYPIPTRCDLHPNWSRDDSKVLIDSIHEGERQVYEIDVSSLTKA
ncbi:MAG: hypothetical protein IKR81_14050 [Victivallales bacterium]|nr:hypothetical protein [Victivallales bacterium]